MTSFLLDYGEAEISFALRGALRDVGFDASGIVSRVELASTGNDVEAGVGKGFNEVEEVLEPGSRLHVYAKRVSEAAVSEVGVGEVVPGEDGKDRKRSSSFDPIRAEVEVVPPVIDDRRLLAGATTVDISLNDKDNVSWCNGTSRDFKVRCGPDYARNKKKASSDSALYKQIGMDVFTNKYDARSKIFHVAEHVRFPKNSIKDYSKKCPLPRIIIINIQLPIHGPKLFGKPEPDPGVSLVQYFEIKQTTYDEIMSGRPQSAALKLWTKFYQRCTSDEDMARRFKLLGIVQNLKELGLPSMFQGYNGKPAIVHKTGKIFKGELKLSSGEKYFEMDISVHGFAYLARKAIHTLADRIPAMHLACGYLIQGEDDRELPEGLLACGEIKHLGLNKGKVVKIKPL
mmetsp:Transcript_8215/g.13272  ORF Transcript_8215/g.13272 Transcript_8215/m.13272 type:complete len:400 (-) Transcript_8215:962-2161(-)